MKKIVEIAHGILYDHLKKDSVAVDFTMGNGFDTLFLSKNSQHVFAFDIQIAALLHTGDLLEEEKRENVTLIYSNHALCDRFIYQGYDVGIFNFGYLPNDNKVVTTTLESSKLAVEKALCFLRGEGVLVLVLYPGHKEGQRESDYFIEYTKKLDSQRFKVTYVSMWNQKVAPYILAIEKIGDRYE